MANLSGVVEQLEEERNAVQSRLQDLERAISVLQDLGTLGAAGKSQRLSSRYAAARRIPDTQSAVDRVRAITTGGDPAHTSARVFSVAGRRRIAAAQKARWAKFRAERSKN